MAEDDRIPTDRRSPVGAPVIRGDRAITGERAREAVQFDPDDAESVALAAEVVAEFATAPASEADQLYMLRGAAACAALVRAAGSYKAAAERAGDGVTVPFIRKWARVHDLPRPIRIQVARGNIAPTAAKHIARVAGEARYHLAWATLDHDLTVREVRALASEINEGRDVDAVLADADIEPGQLSLSLPTDVYRAVRRQAAMEGVEPDELVAAALESQFG
ncbi:MAG: hypothetical protein U5J98_10530 [Halobacteriales archaeon]|nr:hypothetical protein [Halobacteriales archaeon]